MEALLGEVNTLWLQTHGADSASEYTVQPSARLDFSSALDLCCGSDVVIASFGMGNLHAWLASHKPSEAVSREGFDLLGLETFMLAKHREATLLRKRQAPVRRSSEEREHFSAYGVESPSSEKRSQGATSWSDDFAAESAAAAAAAQPGA